MNANSLETQDVTMLNVKLRVEISFYWLLELFY